MIIDKSTNIADNVHGVISISEFEKRIISTTLFNRLHGVLQNSTAYLTFPSNRTKRFEHSLGTMFLSSKILFYSFSNANDKDLSKFFNVFKLYLDKVFKNVQKETEYNHKLAKEFKRISKEKDNIKVSGGIYNRLIPSNVSSNFKTQYCILLEAVRICALLHDVGHPPFSHVTESALNSVYHTINNMDESIVKNKRTKLFSDIMKSNIDEFKQLHESIGMEIAKNLTLSAISDCQNPLNNEDYMKQLFEIVVREVVLGIFEEKNDLLEDIHKIIDGTLDSDRLDYVTRDAMNSGLNTGMIEYERLLNSMKFCNRGERYLFCVSTKVLNTLDNFISRRFDIYKNIIFHHRVVKTDYLLKNTICSLIYKYLEEDIDEEENQNILLPNNISGLWKAIEEQPSETEYAKSLIQWDDSWMLTVLKNSFFEYNSKPEDKIVCKLEELLTNKKTYTSVVKKKEDFGEIDYAMVSVINEEFKKITDKYNSLSEKSKNLDSMDKQINIDRYMEKLEKLIEIIKNYNISKSHLDSNGYIIPRISHIFTIPKIISFNCIIDKALKLVKKNWDEKLLDIIIVQKSFSAGTAKELVLYKTSEQNKDVLVSYKTISNMPNEIKSAINFYPCFYVYIRRKNININFHELRIDIGKNIGACIIESVLQMLDNLG